MNAVALFILIAGIVCLVIGYCQNQHVCPPPKIEYRYIPRSFYEEQLSVPQTGQQFYSMFQDNSAWMSYPTNILQPIRTLNTSYNSQPTNAKRNIFTPNYFTTQ